MERGRGPCSPGLCGDPTHTQALEPPARSILTTLQALQEPDATPSPSSKVPPCPRSPAGLKAREGGCPSAGRPPLQGLPQHLGAHPEAPGGLVGIGTGFAVARRGPGPTEQTLCFFNLALSLSFIHSISSCAVLTVGEALCLGLTSRSKLVGQGPRSSWSSRSSWEDRQ